MLENTLLEEDLQEVSNEVKESFKIDSLEGATWALRKLRAIEAKEAEISLVAENEKARIDKWEESEKKSLEGDKAYFEGILEAYYREEREKDKKFKISTPYGKVSGSKSTSWLYKDEKKLLEYIENNSIPAIRIKKEIDKPTLKKIFVKGVNPETGEILPFVEVKEVESITIKVEK